MIDRGDAVNLASAAVSRLDTGSFTMLTDKAVKTLADAVLRMDEYIRSCEAVERWIPVSERLPKEYSTVLLTDGTDTISGFFLGGVSCRHDGDPAGHIWKATHWMPLPPSPTDTEERK